MIEAILIILFLFALPWILFVIPMVYADNQCKGLFQDFNSYPVDYKE